MTGAPLLPDGSPLITEDETIPSTAVTASQLVPVSEIPDVAGTGDVVETTVRRALPPQEPDGNVSPVGEEVEEEVRSDSMGDAAMTTTTSPGETSAVTSVANTLSNSNSDLYNALRRSYEGMSANQRQAMARDDVPASLRRRLSGTIPYAEQSRSTVAEEVEPLPALT